MVDDGVELCHYLIFIDGALGVRSEFTDFEGPLNEFRKGTVGVTRFFEEISVLRKYAGIYRALVNHVLQDVTCYCILESTMEVLEYIQITGRESLLHFLLKGFLKIDPISRIL